jgi:F-type H+-transporting ATPase subunit b
MTSLSAFTLLATHGGGFGLNLNLFETNIINLAIVIAGLVWFLKGFLGGILDRRRQAILSELKDAEERLAAATTSLAAVKKDLADAQQRAETIRAEGQARAEAIRLESPPQAGFGLRSGC